MEINLPRDKAGLLLKVGLFAFLALAGLVIFGPMLYPLAGYLLSAALGTFAAAAIANAVALRVFERGHLADIGLGWQHGSSRNLLLGLGSGVVAACAVVGGPLIVGIAELEPSADRSASLPSFLFLSFALLFGAIGEEMLFRGYGFQLLLGALGRAATILPVSVLFGLAHSSNQNVSHLGLVNTIGFGIVLGYAFTRSGDLWLPIGIHFGWNWTFPLFGVNLSGFTMGVTGFAIRWKVGEIWSGGSYGPEASILTSFVVVSLMVFLYRAPVQPQNTSLARSLPEA